MKATVQEGYAQLDPGVILADDNSRFGLKPWRVEALAQSILEQGGVMQPIEVEPLKEPVDGKQYRLTSGFYRHAAVNWLNDQNNAGLKLPASIKPLGDDSQRLKRQLAENMERENQSPMDKAIAIKRLEDAGVTRAEIKKIFSTPGGRKGMVLQPASNSFINMTLSFLDLPKAIQEKIHDGRVGVAAAYELTKVHPDKRAAVLARAEEDRLKQIEAEEKDENKFLESEKKANEAIEKKAEAEAKLKEAQSQTEALQAAKEAALQKAAETYKLSKAAKGEEKAKAEEAHKAAEAEAKEVAAKADKLTSEVSKLALQTEKATKLAEERSKVLENARKLAAGKKAIGSGDVKKAAQQVENGNDFVAPTITQVRSMVASMAGAQGAFPKAREVFVAFSQFLTGEITDRQLYSKLAVITGEKVVKTKGKAATE